MPIGLRNYERLAMPLALTLLAFILLVPLFTSRRLASSTEELQRVADGRRALVDLQLAIAQTTANALTPRQDSATHARLREALAKSDSAAARLRLAVEQGDSELSSDVDTLMQRLAAAHEGPAEQTRTSSLVAVPGGAPVDQSTRLTDLLDAVAGVDSSLTDVEGRATTHVASELRDATLLIVALAVASAAVALLMAWLSRRLRGTTAELEQRVASESQARTAADTAVAQRDQVLRIVSHDLKNPLHTIGMAVQVVRDPAFSEDAREQQIGVITRSVERMRRLVGDLLDVARLESGQALAIAPRPVPLHDMLLEACDIFTAPAKEKSVTLDVHAVPDCEVIADRGRVVQVLTNLVGNAIKFTPPKGIVRVEAEPNGKYTSVRVTNNGPAISRELLPRLFRPFSQARDTAGLGTGLGLSIAKGIVEAHGGEIHVSSGEGQLTTFEFTLPLARCAPEQND